MSRKLLFLLLTPCLFSSTRLSAQLSGVYSVPSTYTSIGAAINALNSFGVSGAVTINVSPGHTETVPTPSGYTLGTIAGASSVNTIVFRKNGSGANPVIFASTGTATPISAIQDGVWLFVGTDYVTVDGINILDPNSTNPATMEFGYGFFKANAANGCQHNIIRNCVVTLNAVNNAFGSGPSVDGSRGIHVSAATPSTQTSALTVTASSGSNSDNHFYTNTIQNCNVGISLFGFSAGSPFTLADQDNDIGGSSIAEGNTIVNFGGGGNVASATGIRTQAQYNVRVANNVVNSNNGLGTNHLVTLRGIFLSSATSANASVLNNTVTVKGGGTNQSLSAIENSSGSSAASNGIVITGNLITGCTYSTATSGQFLGIFNSASCASITISQNTLTNNSTGATSGNAFFIISSGAVSTNINLSQNSISGFTFTGIGSPGFTGISNSSGFSSALLTISSNSFQGIVTTATPTGNYVLLNNSLGAIQQNINDNRFINLSLGNSGSATFISNGAGIAANGFQSVSNNSIVGTFSKPNGGVAILYSSSGFSGSNASLLHSGNNFSNMNMGTGGSISGWNENNNGATKTVTGNVFQSWSSGSGVMNALTVNSGIANSVVSSNTIAGLTTSNSIVGLTYGSGNSGSVAAISGNFILGLTSSTNIVTGMSILAASVSTLSISDNTIGSLSGNVTGTVTGITCSAQNPVIFRNRVYNVENLNGSGSTNGLLLNGGTISLSYNNLIGDLRTPSASATNALSGINVSGGSTHHLFYNTVYLSGSSTGTAFGSSALNVGGTATIHIQNNIFVNLSSPTGTAATAAFRRVAGSFGTYSVTSNRNIFYAGTPSSSNLLYDDGTFQLQTLADMQTTVSPRESSSATENVSFLNLSGANATFLHVNPAVYTNAESGGANVAGITTDADLQIRAGNTGYTGSGSAPDIGADEFTGSQAPCSSPAAGTTSISATQICAGQSVTLNNYLGSGGPDFSYQWKTSPTSGGTYSNVSGGIGSTDVSYSTSALSAGTYFYILVTTCTVTSASASSTPVSVTVNPLPVISTPDGTLCSGKSFTLSPTGATSYTFSSGSAVVSPSLTTSYTITGSTGQCPASNTSIVQITVSASPTVAIASTTICPGQSYTLSPSGAATYSYHSGGPVVTPPTTTTYPVSGTSTAGCISVNTAVATISVQTSFSISAPNGTICPTKSFVITPTGGATYTFSSGSATVSPSSTTNYSVTGRSAAGCPASNTAVVNVFVAPNPSITAPSGTVCTGKSYTIVPSGAATYTYSGGGPVVTPTANSSYSVTGTSSLGCPASNTAVLAVNLAPLPTVSISNGTLCTGKSYTLSPSGAVTYTFSSGSAVVSPTNITSYSVIGTGTNGCVSNPPAIVTLTAYVTPVITINGPYLGCSGVPITYTATGANTYTWSNGSVGLGHLTPSATIVYSVTGEDIVGCKAVAHRTLFVTATPTLVVSNDTAICQGKSIALTVSGSNTYTWNTGATSPTLNIIPTVSQVFTVAGTSSGCTGTAAVQVTVDPAPVITATSDRYVICSGEQVTFSAAGASSLTWSGGAVTGSPFTPTLSSYTVTGSGANGCMGYATLSITVHSLPAIVVTSNKNPLCIGEFASLFVNGPFSYTWSTGAHSASISVSPIVETVYTIVGESSAGCRNTASLTLKVTDCTALESQFAATWQIYPNPGDGHFNLRSQLTGSDLEIRVFTIDGRLVVQHAIVHSVQPFDLSELPNGLYYAWIFRSGEPQLRQKLIKN